jgi:hypothetical protein
VLAVRNGIFRKGLSLHAFARSFFSDNVEIKSNRERRWVLFLRAERNGTLLDRPQVAPLWKPYKTYHEPMFDVLQSSYADVEHELNVMRNVFIKESVLFVAGDGLALMRLNHLLAAKPELYFDSAPFIIPVQGVYTSLTARARRRGLPRPLIDVVQASIHTGFFTLCIASGASIANSLCGALRSLEISRSSRTRTSQSSTSTAFSI